MKSCYDHVLATAASSLVTQLALVCLKLTTQDR